MPRGIGYHPDIIRREAALTLRLSFCALLLAGLAACGPNYSPDTYATTAVQQANKVEQGVIVGVRKVDVSATGTTGAVTGAAAGGIAGAQVGTGPVTALTTLGGTLIGGIAGTAVEHTTSDTTAYEYIVRKPNGDLISVTQKDKAALALGMHVLVIAGTQARIVPDYIVSGDKAAKPDPDKAKADQDKPQDKPKPEQDRTATPGSDADAGQPASAPPLTLTTPSPTLDTRPGS